MNELTGEEKYIFDTIVSARKIQEFLWSDMNQDIGLEEWRRIFRKRIHKIDGIKPENPHWKIELKKRLLQNAALSIAMLYALDKREIPEGIHPTLPSNLPEYAQGIVEGEANRQKVLIVGNAGAVNFKESLMEILADENIIFANDDPNTLMEYVITPPSKNPGLQNRNLQKGLKRKWRQAERLRSKKKF